MGLFNLFSKIVWKVKRSFIKKSDSRPWEYIIIHHSATRDDGERNDWEAIRRYHKAYAVNGNIVNKQEFTRMEQFTRTHNKNHYLKRPWDDIGYHYGIERSENTLKVKEGRKLSKVGAHAYILGNNNYNLYGIGVCLVGNFNAKEPDTEQFDMLVWIVKQLQLLYDIPTRHVLGHREVYTREHREPTKSCPGAAFDMDKFRSRLV